MVGVRIVGLCLCAVVTLAGCGQRGPLYMPDRNGQVVTRAGSSAPSAAPSSAPSSAPAAEPR